MATTIKSFFSDKIKKDDLLLALIAKANGVRSITITRWLEDNDSRLTTADSLEVIKSHFGLLEASEILEETVVEKV